VVIFAKDREDLVAATMRSTACCCGTSTSCRNGTIRSIWARLLDKFGMPEKQPAYAGVDVDSWWIDKDKEAALAAKYKGAN
jgi:microcin C transport system substrate-binding protein